METPPSVVIIGSFRKDLAEIGIVAQHMRAQGIDVRSPRSHEGIDPSAEFVILRSDSPTASPRTQQRNVLSMIPTASLVYLVNPNGHVGMSAAAEVSFSALVGARVLLHRMVSGFGADVPAVFRELVQQAPYQNQLSSPRFADLVALASKHTWDLTEAHKEVVRAEIASWMQSLSDVKPCIDR